ncbi:MAG: glycine cleavage T C-terminal barrel domain-containing protein, partial [Leptospirales bacterium]
ASRASVVLSHIQKTLEESALSLNIQTYTNHCLIALQGPESEKILCNVFPQHKQSIQDSGYYRFNSYDDDGLIMIARTGYTGEDGFELFIAADEALKVWEELEKQKVQKCGLAARDLLRMEVFYPLYGNELSEEITPYEASLERLVDETKEFIGKPRLLEIKEKTRQKTRGIIMQTAGAIPRQGYKVCDENGNEIGKCTSGGFSFTWNMGFGIVLLDEKYAEQDQKVWVEIRSQQKPGIIQIKSPLKGSIKRKNG